MSKRLVLFTAALSSLLTLTILASFLVIFSRARAAPVPKAEDVTLKQASSGRSQFISVSALAFEAVQQNTPYDKDVQLQLLSLTGQVRNLNNGSALFAAPLTLPDRSLLVGMTVFGEDFDNLGEVGLRLKRCNHGQAFCVILAETTSTIDYAAGRFETPGISVQNEVVDNQFYSYFLELDLTAVSGSGLRSVRLELVTNDSSTDRNETQWSLSGNVRLFQLPNSTLRQVQICTGDLSHLPNSTHFPYVIADGKRVSLFPQSCESIWGSDIEIRRELNTGPSNGTYRFLRNIN